MKSPFIQVLIITLTGLTLAVSGQLVVDNSPPYNSPQNLVQDVLLGTGVTASNIIYSGSSTAIGYFDGTGSNIGLDSGIVMCSGSINTAVGPNNNGGSTIPAGGLGLPGNPLLNNLITGFTTNDAAVLQLDFIPSSDTIKFRYVFGSEEYMEWVNSSFNDVFGFFLTGPNPAGGTYNNINIAQIPGTTMPVSINNVNGFVNNQYYINNETPPGPTVQFDGFTVPLTAQAHVVCGQTYTITLAVADAGDWILDSGVFLEGSSFSSFGGITINTSATFYTGTADTSLVEGCGYATIDIIRTGDLNDTIMVYASYSGTATNGIDFSLLPDTFHLFPNDTLYTMQLDPLFDNTNEGTESFFMFFTPVLATPIDTNCFSVAPAAAGFSITDPTPLFLTVSPDVYLDCPGDTVNITAQLTGGNGNNILSWNTGLVTTGNTSTSSFNIIPTMSTTYVVTATDTCGTQVLVDSIFVFVPSFSSLTESLEDTVVCPGETLLLDPNITGGDGNYIYSWSTGSTSNNIIVNTNNDSLYFVDVLDGCGDMVFGQSFISVSVPPVADFQHNIASDYAVVFNNTSISGDVYLWDFGDGMTSSEEHPMHYYAQSGVYTVLLYAFNQDGCMDTTSYMVEINPEYAFFVPDAFTPNRDDINDLFFGDGFGFVNYKMHIFDRWGEKVFYTGTYLERWDGTLPSGKKAQQDVYIYIIELELPLSETKEITGRVTLIR